MNSSAEKEPLQLETRILLGGGGSAVDERAILERFASWVGLTEPVLYLPIATPNAGRTHDDWIRSALNPFGVSNIETWYTLEGHNPGEIEFYAGIFIGGGNSYYLLHQLRTADFAGAIVEYASNGRVLYGGSAGAIVLGRDIGTCAHQDENSVALCDNTGLNLAHGHAIWCHYQPAEDPLVRAYITATHVPTIALAETAGVWVQGPGRLVPLGTGCVLRFTPTGVEDMHSIGC
jgi:dipeptidase E